MSYKNDYDEVTIDTDNDTTMRPLPKTPKPTFKEKLKQLIPKKVTMERSPPSMKPKVDYAKTFSKEFMLLLSCLQMLSGFLAITTEIVYLASKRRSLFATGIWCGIVYGLSGFTGVFASLRPSKSTIVSFMVMAILASLLCLPGLVFPSLFMHIQVFDTDDFDNKPAIGHAMLVSQMVIAVVQAVAAIASSVMTCKAICGCCRRGCFRLNREDRTVNYTV